MKKFRSLLICLTLIVTMAMAIVMVACTDNLEEFTLSLSVDGEIMHTLEVNEESKIDDLLDINMPAKDGYRFMGWYLDANLNTPFYSSQFELEDVVLYSKWEAGHTVTFDYCDGRDDSIIVVFDLEILDDTTDSTKDGYLLDGWYLDSDFTEEFDISTPITNDITLSAKWIEAHTVTIVRGGILKPIILTVKHGYVIENQTSPELRWYQFTGWMVQGSDGQDELWEIDVDVVLDDITIVAQWVNNPQFESEMVINNVKYRCIEGDLQGFKEGYYVVGSYSEIRGHIIIPNTVNYEGWGFPVIGISEGSFSNRYRLTSVVISDNIKSIGDSAFSKCYNLTSINIPDSITIIGDSAFSECSSLESIVLPNSVLSIGESAFYSWSSLESINLPNSITYIGVKAFYYCSSLESVVLPNFITNILSNTFAGCSSLSSVIIQDGVTAIADNVFNGCYKLASIKLPESIEIVYENSFDHCIKMVFLVEAESIPTSWSSEWNNQRL